MIINPVDKKFAFKRAFTTSERKRAETAQKKAKELLDIDKIIMIAPETSLPAGSVDIGIGQMNSENALEFFKFMQSYAGINNIKVLPPGELFNRNGFYCSYGSPALTLGPHMINLEELASEKMGGILSRQTFEKVISSASTDKNFAHYENVVGANSPHNKALLEAFANFKSGTSEQIKALQKDFETYKAENARFIENKALYEILAEKYHEVDFQKWENQTDRELFNSDIISDSARINRINELKNQNKEKIEFTYFKQFLADRSLAESRLKLNANGIKIYGDCLIGFSKDEIWSHPKAFEPEGYIGSPSWRLRSLNFAEIMDENSESYKLLKEKVTQFAKRYDSIRFDVGWAYAEPIIFTDKPNVLDDRYAYDSTIQGYRMKNKLDGKLITKIENMIREVKGNDFDLKNIIYEIEASPQHFSPYDWNNNSVIDAFRGRTIVQSTSYLNNGYATNEMIERRMRIPRENYIFMAGNHDHLSLQSLSGGIDVDNILKISGNDIKQVLDNQYEPLARELKIPEQNLRHSTNEFVKAKFAQLFLAKNIKMFFVDMFGIKHQFDSHSRNSSQNYRLRVPKNYEEEYHRALQQDKGFNIYDSLAKAIKAKGLDKSNGELYTELLNYANILRANGALTEAAANETERLEIKLPDSKKNKYTWIIGTGLVLASVSLYIWNKFSQTQNKSEN